MNRVTLQLTIFENHPQGDRTYGCRIYDDYGQSYCNTWDSFPCDDLKALVMVIRSDTDETTHAILSSIREDETGIYIGDNWYEWDQIKHLFKD